MTETSHLLQLVQTLTASLDSSAAMQETRQRLTYAARDVVEGTDHASLTVRHPSSDSLETSAATDPVVRQLDEVQYALREGPCYDAVTDAELLVSRDLTEDERWPRYASRAVELGVRSQLSIRLPSDTVVAGLNFYAAQPDAFAASLPAVQLVASHARVVFGYAQHLEAVSCGLATRTVIGQAVGILMERHGLGNADALRRLEDLSQSSNIELCDVASSIVRPMAAG